MDSVGMKRLLTPQPMIILLRHAERADHRPDLPSCSNTSDPPLSPDGLKQAEMIGHLIKKHLDNLYPKYHVQIMTSPFTRCYQTSTIVGSVIQSPEMVVDYRLSEVLSKSIFP